jgi:hypothetical protein
MILASLSLEEPKLQANIDPKALVATTLHSIGPENPWIDGYLIDG